MASYQALGTGPISFVDAHQTQQEIPLSAITFGPNGVDASAWPLYAGANQAVVDGLLKQFVAQGLLAPGAQTAATPSLTITATEPGSPGNSITVTFANPSPSAGTVDVTVSATENHPNQTLASLSNELGNSPSTATGLVFLESTNNKQPKNFTGNISVGPAFDCLVPEPGGDPLGAFTLKAANPTSDADAKVIKLVVAPNAAPPNTFTLTDTWTKTVPSVSLATLLNNLTNPFAMVVTFTGPASGPVPAAGTVTLLGGAPATSTPAVPAQVTVFSS